MPSATLPAFLSRRGLPDEYAGKRFIDNEEVGVLSVVDADGNLSSLDALVQFMCLMTKMSKLDHRVLCVEILTRHLDSSLELDFVNLGGYRILKRWIHDAEDENQTSLLTFLVQLTQKLPFDSTAIKRSEIGKAVKKLLKYSSTSPDQELLQKEVQQLIDDWKVKATLEKKELAKTQPVKLEVEAPASQVAASAGDARAKKRPATAREESTEMDVETEPIKIEPHEPSSSIPTPSSRQPAALPGPPVRSLLDKPLLPTLASPAITAAMLTKPAPVRERKSLDMLEGARKLLALKSKAAPQAEEATPLDGGHAKSQLPPADLKPLPKGGLKKSDAPRKEKRNVQWADETGGLLREVHAIEVEKIKSSVANYKSHKDLVRRERQLEKETYLSKAEEAMQPVVKFALPPLWSLPIGIVDNMGTATSEDRDRQTRRLAHVLEARYLDESLIPDDPDVDSSAMQTTGGETSSVTASWFLPEEEEEERMALRGAEGGSHGVRAQLPAAQTLLPSMTSHQSEEAFNLLVSSMPLQIQMLDPSTLQMVVQDNGLLQSLLLPDGSVDENRLSLLQSCSSTDEYKALVMGSTMIQQFGGGGFGHGAQAMGGMGQSFGGGSGGGGGGGYEQMDSYGGGNGRQLWGERYNDNEAGAWNNVGNMPMNSNSRLMGMNMSTNMGSGMERGMGGSSGMGSAPKRFPTTKASTPCRFFNTPRGCSNGDKCPFGHFLDGSGGGNAHGGPSGSSMMQGRTGPGSRMGRNDFGARGPKRR